MRTDRTFWLLVLALAVIAVIPVHRTLLGETLGAFDQIRQMAPWNGPKPAQPWDVLQADGVLQFYVWRDLVLESWGRGQLPLWNPYQLGGTPLLANSQSGAMYPPHIKLGLLHFPTPLATGLLAWFHLFWAGIGAALLVRRLSDGAGWIAPLVAGASFALSPFLLGWLALSSVPATTSWIPWLILGVLGLFEDDSRLRCLAGTAACAGLMLLAGHLQFAAYGMMAGVVVAIWRAVERKRPVGLALSLAALGLGGAAALPQLGPVLDYSAFSHRRNVPTEEGFAAYQGGAIKPYELVGAVFPVLTGLPTQGIPIDDQGNQISAYWPGYVKRGGNFAEGALGLGALAFGALFLLTRRSLLEAGPILGVGVLGLLLALGSPLGKLLYFGFPGWSSTGSPGRAAVLFVLAGCVAAGVALAGAKPKSGVSGWTPVIAVALALAVSLGYVRSGAAALSGWIPNTSPELVPTVVAAVPLGLALIGALLAVVALAPVKDAPRWLPLVGLAGAVTWIGLVRTTTKDQTDLRIEAPEGAVVAFVNEPWDLLSAAPALAPPNLASLSRVRDIAGYDSLLHRDLAARLNDVNGQDSAPPANGNIMFVKPSASAEKLAALGVTEVWSRRPLEGFGEPVRQVGQDVIVYALEPTGSVPTPPHDPYTRLSLHVGIGGAAWLLIGGLAWVGRRKSLGEPPEEPVEFV